MDTEIKQQNVFSKPLSQEVLVIIKEYAKLSEAQKKDEQLISALISRYEETEEKPKT